MYHDDPVQGLVRFTPGRLWVVYEGITWACLAPTITVGPSGKFVAYLTATDADSVPFTYTVETPAGAWVTYVPWAENGYSLRDLLKMHGDRIPS